MASRLALVTGISGQDGSYLTELLLEEGYTVVGVARSPDLGSSHHLRERIETVEGDLLDPAGLKDLVAATRPDELYHLAGPTFPWGSWDRLAETLAAIATATASLLEAVRDHSPKTRVFVAASGHIFGSAPESPQREETLCRPQDPYSIAKLAVHQLVGRLRERDRLFACSGILYNHESERRPQTFVSRKITRAAAAIKLGLAQHVVLGDLDAVRDWSFAGDIVRGAWLMLQQPKPDDYILASGVPHTVRELAEIAFAQVGLEAREHMRVDQTLVRPADGTPMVGDSSRARERLGWRATVTFEQLIRQMVDADLRELEG